MTCLGLTQEEKGDSKKEKKISGRVPAKLVQSPRLNPPQKKRKQRLCFLMYPQQETGN
ncbi:rCG59287, partial [Rattus norvegicus]